MESNDTIFSCSFGLLANYYRYSVPGNAGTTHVIIHEHLHLHLHEHYLDTTSIPGYRVHYRCTSVVESVFLLIF